MWTYETETATVNFFVLVYFFFRLKYFVFLRNAIFNWLSSNEYGASHDWFSLSSWLIQQVAQNSYPYPSLYWWIKLFLVPSKLFHQWYVAVRLLVPANRHSLIPIITFARCSDFRTGYVELPVSLFVGSDPGDAFGFTPSVSYCAH